MHSLGGAGGVGRCALNRMALTCCAGYVCMRACLFSQSLAPRPEQSRRVHLHIIIELQYKYSTSKCLIMQDMQDMNVIQHMQDCPCAAACWHVHMQVSVDPSGLAPGLHYAEVAATDAKVRMGACLFAHAWVCGCMHAWAHVHYSQGCMQGACALVLYMHHEITQAYVYVVLPMTLANHVCVCGGVMALVGVQMKCWDTHPLSPLNDHAIPCLTGLDNCSLSAPAAACLPYPQNPARGVLFRIPITVTVPLRLPDPTSPPPASTSSATKRQLLHGCYFSTPPDGIAGTAGYSNKDGTALCSTGSTASAEVLSSSPLSLSTAEELEPAGGIAATGTAAVQGRTVAYCMDGPAPYTVTFEDLAFAPGTEFRCGTMGAVQLVQYDVCLC